ncbi:hypothetical protein OKW30_008329 [Paraburkholderia sp. Clong3]|uniref:tyrosine-protein phosphatase n=1 Tax=Paraburkholderia sp. Clong3 TaxID=2991061 RepID=UPI003D20CCFC
MLNTDAVSNAKMLDFPFRWGGVDGVLPADGQATQMCDDFPVDSFRYQHHLNGRYMRRLLIAFGTNEAFRGEELSGAYRELASDLTSGAYRSASSQATGVDLSNAPMEATMWRSDAGTQFAAHDDQESKLLTHVIYLNQGWTKQDGGVFQVLASKNENDVAFEILPRLGLSVVIPRSDDSWHNITAISPDAPDSRNTITVHFYRPGTSEQDLPVREVSAQPGMNGDRPPRLAACTAFSKRCRSAAIDPTWQRVLCGIGVNLRPLAERAGICAGIYRTGDVTAIDRQGARLLRDRFGIRNYIDLRSEDERRRYGDADALEAAGIAVVPLPIVMNDRSAIGGRHPGVREYADYYCTVLEDMKPCVPDLFSCFAASGGAPFLFGCHAGKDRTGLVSMLLLHVCGAGADIIARDHERSGGCLAPHLDRFRDQWERKGETRGDYAVRLACKGETMHQIMLRLGEVYGGLDGYLKHCGVRPALQHMLRDRYRVAPYAGGVA